MNEQDLLPNEKIITSSANNEVILTNHRLRKVSSESSNTSMTSILLRNISSIYVISKSNPLYLILSVLLFVGAYVFYVEGVEELALVLGVIGTVFIVLYFKSKQHTITIASSGGANINLFTKGMKSSVVVGFVNKVERAIIEEDQLK